jgi:hypothetical protein
LVGRPHRGCAASLSSVWREFERIFMSVSFSSLPQGNID